MLLLAIPEAVLSLRKWGASILPSPRQHTTKNQLAFVFSQYTFNITQESPLICMVLFFLCCVILLGVLTIHNTFSSLIYDGASKSAGKYSSNTYRWLWSILLPPATLKRLRSWISGAWSSVEFQFCQLSSSHAPNTWGLTLVLQLLLLQLGLTGSAVAWHTWGWGTIYLVVVIEICPKYEGWNSCICLHTYILNINLTYLVLYILTL